MSRSFLSKNVVMVVMLPVLVGAHYGWYKLQAVDDLVPAKDRSKLPAPLAKVCFHAHDVIGSSP